MTPLEREIRRRIAIAGPIPVSCFMALCLTHPQHGYYVTGDPLGAAGDFVTAPEVSQMFGELIGLWAASVWHQMGAPERVRLVELGPGRGTLMADALRAAKVMPQFRRAVSVDLIEISPSLRLRQAQALHRLDLPLRWHMQLATVPDEPLIVIANEFVDALPVDQVVRSADGWHRRMVSIDGNGRLAFALDPAPLAGAHRIVPARLQAAPVGSLFEWRAETPIGALAARLIGRGGAALFIDYGHVDSGCGDTLQAVRRHRFANVLDAPGELDLTAHVDFAALGRAAAAAGARVHGPVPQGAFLRRLGIEARAAALAAAAPAQAPAVDAALARLAGSEPDQMGDMFKALAIAPPCLGPLPGFDS